MSFDGSAMASCFLGLSSNGRIVVPVGQNTGDDIWAYNESCDEILNEIKLNSFKERPLGARETTETSSILTVDASSFEINDFICATVVCGCNGEMTSDLCSLMDERVAIVKSVVAWPVPSTPDERLYRGVSWLELSGERRRLPPRKLLNIGERFVRGTKFPDDRISVSNSIICLFSLVDAVALLFPSDRLIPFSNSTVSLLSDNDDLLTVVSISLTTAAVAVHLPLISFNVSTIC